MRIGFGRLAQKSSTKHVPVFRNVLAAINVQQHGAICYHFHQHRNTRKLPCRAYTTSAARLDAAEKELQWRNTIVKNMIGVRAVHSKRYVSVGKTHEDAVKSKKSASKDARARRDLDALIASLNPYLPEQLQADQHLLDTNTPNPFKVDGEPYLRILQILHDEFKPSMAQVDLLTFMGIKQGRWKAVLWLVNTLLQEVSARMLDPQVARSPSNIVWGSEDSSLGGMTTGAVSVQILSYTETQSVKDGAAFHCDPRYSDIASQQKDRTMAKVWYSLGSMIIEAADLPQSESEVAMAAVYQIIAKIHALGLVPDNVYSYTTSEHSTMVRRPPILHLLSSRILTTLSDATWRSHQMEVIEQAVEGGTPLQSLIKDLPGGRFRLKVRPLGPEIWLEFVLWCCVEGGFSSSGARLIRRLRHQTEHPWFAVPWKSEGGKVMSNTVDWNQVRLRHGGSVGLIEGYSREPPFVEMVPRTVSAEVVLSLVECMVTAVGLGRSRGWIFQIIDREIPRLIEFLEPHSLPDDYFDYLAVRILQTDAFDAQHDRETLERWVQRLTGFRSLETSYESSPATATFDIPSIVKQSETHAGILHQAMEAHVELFDVRRSVAVFNRIQELVDSSKLQSISAFLATTSVERDRFFNSQEFFSQHTATNSVDFLRSHGQLPLHKLASFLNLATESNLLRIGQWLLYSDDVDEPVIPPRLYGKPSLTTALVRFAIASVDEELLRKLISARKQSPLLPSVSLLRSWVDAFISAHSFDEADRTLQLLRKAKAGGYGLTNLASSTAAALRLEHQAQGLEDTVGHIKGLKFREALQLAGGMIAGHYNPISGILRQNVTAAFYQQVAAMLQVWACVRGSRISSFARQAQTSYQLNNGTILSAEIFNLLLASVVETKGAVEGMRLWQLFCNREISSNNDTELMYVNQNLVQSDVSAEDEELFPPTRVIPVSASQRMSGQYVPFVPSESEGFVSNPAEAANDTADMLKIQHGTLAALVDFANPFPVVADEIETQEDPEPISLVNPDLRTLRVIVRGALAERRTRSGQNLDVTSQREVLDWAASLYPLFGVEKDVVEEETQQTIDDFDSVIQQRKLHEANLQKIAEASRARRSVAGNIYLPFRRPNIVLGLQTRQRSDPPSTKRQYMNRK